MKQAITGGLIAGLVFLIVEMALVPTVGGGSAFGPPRMMAAIVMGQSVLPPPATFEAVSFIVGMAVHFALSAVLGAVFWLAVSRVRLSGGALIFAGTAFGLAVYLVNFYGFTAIFPWFAMARNAITIFAHLIFGACLGWWLARERAPAAEAAG